eukprot:3323751-Pleurochrysis_carterae.AAC.1
MKLLAAFKCRRPWICVPNPRLTQSWQCAVSGISDSTSRETGETRRVKTEVNFQTYAQWIKFVQ